MMLRWQSRSALRPWAAALVLAISLAACQRSAPGVATAAEFQAEIDAAKAAVPLPPEATWPPYVDVTDRDASYETGGGRSQVEGVALCLWVGAWLDGEEGSDVAARDRAAEVIVGVPAWELYRGRFAEQSFRDVLDGVVEAVRQGHGGLVVHDAARPLCAGTWGE